jgi:Tfp pilus assembly protein PilF
VFLPLGGPAGRPYILSIFLFLLGLLSKVTVVTLPIILLLVDWQQKRKITKDVLIEKIPYFALSIFFGLVAFGGKQDLLVQTNIFEKILLACKTTVFGLRQILFPVQLSVFHPELHPIQFVSIDFLLPIAVLIIIATALWRFRKTHPELLFGALFFLITLAPSFLTVTKGGNIFFFSDRYAYLPSIGILFALGSLFFSIKKIPLFHRMMTAGVIAVVFSVITVHQSLLWGSGVALFSRAATLYPEFYLAHINVGAGLRQEGKKEEAIKSFKKAVSLYKLPNTYGLIGQVYAEEGNYPEAIEYFEKGLSLLPEDPELHYGLGQVYALRGDFLAAEESYKTALRYSEDDDSYSQLARRISGRRDKIFFRLGLLEGKQGNHDQAMRYQKMAIKENPYFTDAYYNLAVGLGLTNQRDEAILYLKKVLEIDPLHIPARVNLGILYGQTNRLEEAMNELQRVLQIDPLNPTALSLMEHLR